MAKYIVYTDDGLKHYLPDYVTDENYFEEKEKFLSAYTPQFQSQPQPKTKIIPTDELSHTQKVLQSLIPVDLNFTETEGESSFVEQVIGGAKQAKNAANFYALSATAPELLKKQQLLDSYIALEGIRPLTSKQEADKEQLILDIKGTGKSQKELDKKRKNISFQNLYSVPPMAQAFGDLLQERQDKGLEQRVQENIQDTKENNEYIQSLGHSKAFNALAESEGLIDAFAFLNPYSENFDLSLPLEVMGTSFVPMLASLGAGVGTTLATGNVLAGSAATGFTSGAIDNAYSYIEYLQKKGMDVNNPQSVAKFMGNKELIAEAKKYARIRGTAIGTFDALSFGMATKVFNPFGFQNIFAKQAMNTLIQAPLQGALGGAGEATGQYFTLEEGETLRFGDINMEIIGEFAFAPAEAILGQASAGFQDIKKSQALKTETQYRLGKNFFEIYLEQMKQKGFGEQAEKIAFDINKKSEARIEGGENPLKAFSETIEEYNNDMPGFGEAFEIYKSFTDEFKNPTSFPSKIVTENSETPNAFLVKDNGDNTFSITDYQGNVLINPKTNQPFLPYDSLEKAGQVSSGLNLIGQTQYAVEKVNDYILMQNLDSNNSTIQNLGLKISNPYYDGISFQELNEIGVSQEIIKTIQDATGNQANVAISQLKNILSKAQFDKVMNARSENILLNESSAPNSVSAATIKRVLKNKNIDSDVNDESFKRLALHFTGESSVEKMSVAQRRVLYSVIESLPPSTDLILLPDFTHRSYSLNDYSKAINAIEESKKTTLKIIKDATGLNNSEAKRLKEDLITSGYIKNNKWVGTGSQKYNFDGSIKFAEDIKINEDLDNFAEDFKKQNPEMSIKFDPYIGNIKGNIELEGAYDKVFDEIIIPIDRAGTEYKKDPKKYLNNLARILTHENWHALRQADVFTEDEYNTLANFARTKKPKGSKKTYLEIITDPEGAYNTPEALELSAIESQSDIIEEAIGLGFEEFGENKKNVTGKPQQIFNKVENFFASLTNSLKGNGFTNATDIFNRVTSGEIANRQRGVVRTTLETDRTETEFANIFERGKQTAGVADVEDLPDIQDSPTLKFSLKNSSNQDGKPKSPLVNEFLFGAQQKQFSTKLNKITNALFEEQDIFDNYLLNRRKTNLNNNNDVKLTQNYFRLLSSMLLQNQFGKDVTTIPMYMVGDPSRNSQTILHINKQDALKTAQLQGNINYDTVGDTSKLSTVNVPKYSVFFHPQLFNLGKPYISNPYKSEGLFSVDSRSIPLNIVSTEKVNPVIGTSSPRVKYSLKRTEGRMTTESLNTIRASQFQIDNLYKRFADELTGVEEMSGLDYQLVDAILKDIDNQGSDSIAAILQGDEDYIIDNLGLPQYRMGKIDEVRQAIEDITFSSMKYFPEFIVVYRGGEINPNYDVVPVTMNKSIAEDFAAGRLESGYRVSDDDVLTEYLIPRSKVLADINALAPKDTQEDLQISPYERTYSRQYEQELLVNVNDLIPSKLERLGPIELKSIKDRIADEKRIGQKSIKQFDDELTEKTVSLMMSPTLGLGGDVAPLTKEDGTVRGMTDREYTHALNDLRFQLSKINLGNITQKQLSNILKHPALIEAERIMFSQPTVEGKLKPKFVHDLIEIAEAYAEDILSVDKKATFLIGLPASGKSYFAEQLAKKTKSAIIDSDDAKKMMPEFKGGLGANATAPMSSKYAASVMDNITNLGANIIIPSVGGSSKYGSMEKKISMLKSKGYSVDVILIDTDFNHALVRMMNRFVDTGRLIATDYFLDVENTPRDTYNRLKDSGLIDNYAFLNNNFAKGEQTVEEDPSKLLQEYGEPRQIGIGDVRRSYAERSDLASAIEEAETEVELQKQKSIKAGVTPVISDNASPEAKLSAINAQKDIKNASTINLDVDSIIDGIDNNTKLKYSFKKSGKPLKPATERLVKKMTIRDLLPDNETISSKVLKSFKSVDPLKFREAILDQYARIAETDYSAGRKTEQGQKFLSASLSAAAAMYHSDRSGDIYQQAFMHGVPVYNTKKGFTTVVDISPEDGKPIKAPHEIFKNAYNNPQMMWAFQAVLAVKRETRFNNEGRKVKINAKDKKDAVIALQEHPEIQTMIDDYQRWNRHLVRFLIDTGVLDEKTGNVWMEHSDYIPFYRAMEGEEGFKGPQIFQGMQLSPFKRAKGSEEKNIVDPITGITNNARAAINAGMKNVAANRTMRNLVIIKAAEQVKNNTAGPNIVKIKVKGKTKSFSVDDPDNYNLFTVMTGGDFLPTNMLMSVMRGSKRMVSDLITRMPDFWFRQVVRDSMSAWFLSGANYVPILSQLKESAKITYGMMTGNLPEEYVALRNAGIIQGYERGVRDIDSTQTLVENAYKKERYKEKTTLSKVATAPLDIITKVWDILGQGTAITDAATRVSVYKDTLKRTGDVAEALSQAMEVLNFTRRGNNKSFQLVTQSTMFLNPRLQGVDVFYRGLTGKYGIGRGLTRRKRAAAVALRMLSYISLMPYYYLLVRDSEEWEEASEETKDNYIIIPGSKELAGSPLGIPLPFEAGFLTTTVPMRLLAKTFGDDTQKDLRESMVRNITNTLKINPLEMTAIQPLVENYFNYDFYTGRKIVPQYLDDIGDLAYRPSTDTLYKKVGDELNISPLYIENLVSGYTGTAGTYAMTFVDSLITKGPNEAKSASMRVDQLPVVGAFLLPTEGNRLENQFFDLKEMVDNQVESFRVLEKKILDEGDMGALGMTKEYKIEYKEALQGLQKDLKKTSDQLGEIRQAKAIINNSQELSSNQKRDQILELDEIENDLLRGMDISGIRKFYIEELQPDLRIRN